MPKVVKWIGAIVIGLVVLLVGAILIAPLVFNLEKYKPQIESRVAKATGRPFRLGGDLKPSVFPWIGVALSDLRLGNSDDFKEDTFVSIGSFEVRLKLLPLLSGNLELKRFVVDDAHVMLIKNKNGRLNTQGLGRPASGKARPEPSETRPDGKTGKGAPPIKSLQAETVAVVNSRLTWVDHAGGIKKEIKEINLKLNDVSLDRPIAVDFSALADGKQVALRGTVGPVGAKPGQDPLPLDIVIQLVKQLEIKLAGRIDPGGETLRFALDATVAPFDPRALLASLDIPLSLKTADPNVLKKADLALKVSGSPQAVTLTDGRLSLDDSTLTFSGKAEDLSKPHLTLTAALDRLDADRYLPPPADKPRGAPAEPRNGEEKQKTDYGPLRRLILDARLTAGELKAKNLRMNDIEVRARAKDGVVRVDPFRLALYKGVLAAATTLDVRKAQPESDVTLDLSRIQAGPLMKDFMSKEVIDGVLSAVIKIRFNGDQLDVIRQTLDGQGELQFNDGALIGIDLADMVRNVQAAFGAAEKPAEKPRTDFSELLMPFSIARGVARIDGSKMNSPLLRVLADGAVDLVEESLDIRVVPKFVATLMGQGDSLERSGLMAPVLISGNLARPKFRPDLKGLITQQLPGNQDMLKDIEKTKEKVTEDLQQKAQDLIKGLPFGGKK